VWTTVVLRVRLHAVDALRCWLATKQTSVADGEKAKSLFLNPDLSM
jgi:hypothetical protein